MLVLNENRTLHARQFQLGLAAWLCLLNGCGPATISSGTVSLQDITDGGDLTVIAAELRPERQIPWTKPEDVLLTAAFTAVVAPLASWYVLGQLFDISLP